MSVRDQISRYIADQTPPKSAELQELHKLILKVSPNCKLWFLDGRNSEGKIVSNPNIGYGSQTQIYADGKTREFYQVGLSANTTGISAYVMGNDDKTYLHKAYSAKLGKAKITGYCIKFKSTKDINIDVFEDLIASHMGRSPADVSSPS
jgi:hypothetical protein